MKNALVFIPLAVALCARAETVILDRTAPGRTPIDAAIPAGAVTAGDREDNELSLWITAGNGYTGWTWALPSRPDDLYLTDGTERMPLLNPTNPSWGDLGPQQPGNRKELKFALPASWRTRPAKGAKPPALRLVCPRGVFAWGGNSHGDFRVEVWKGVRADVQGWVDNANRCGFVDMKDVPAERYVFTARPLRRGGPGGAARTNAAPSHAGRRTEQTAPVFRTRMPPDGSGVAVEVEAYTRKDGVFRQTVELKPHERPLAAPFAPGEVVVGQCVYDGDRRFADDIVTNDLANLIVSWNKFDTLTGMPQTVRRAFDRKGLRFMTVYGYDHRDLTDWARETLGPRYLWNNVGELAGYLYQGPKEAAAVGVPQDATDLGEARDRFVNVFMQRFVRGRHRDYDYIFSTSGSPLGCYELQGGMDFMANELYAVGSANLAYATSEARGAARKWRPEFWGGWLAEEWQTFPVPYDSEQKYDLLRAGLWQQWLMGTSLIVLESGAQTTQAQKYTAGANDVRQFYDDPAPRRYRRAVQEFYQWTQAHPRDPSGPATPAAFVMGNNDGFVGMSFPSFAIWGQHATAASNANWKCAAPEATWGLAKGTAFPLVEGALRPYPNSWLAATPYGQVDVVQVDDEAYRRDLARYSLLLYAGWNTMTPRIARLLADWVGRGGELLVCLPHLSTRADREMENYTAADLVGGGDLRPLLPLRVTGRASEDGLDYAVFDRLPPGARTLAATPSGKPLVVEVKVGRGRVRLLAAWAYPGKGGRPADLYREQLREMLARHAPPVTVTGDDAKAVSWAVYEKAVYILNMDCVGSRTVTVTYPKGRRETVTLKPCEIWIGSR